MNKRYVVEVVAFEPFEPEDEVVKTIECKSEHEADKVDRGVNINLNHERYYTRITELKP